MHLILDVDFAMRHFPFKPSFETYSLTHACIHSLMHACSLLRIAESVLLVGRYIASRSRREFGAVCGAFADAVRDLLVDWNLYVSTLENNLKGNGEWNLIRIMSSCQQVVDPLYTTACALLTLPNSTKLRDLFSTVSLL